MIFENIFPRGLRVAGFRLVVAVLFVFQVKDRALLSVDQLLASGGPCEIIRKICPLCSLSPLRPRTHRHCSFQTAKSMLVLFHHKHIYTLVRACLCSGTYTFTLDTDSLETLGFNPRTPTLRLRPMTSRLFEYHQRYSLPLFQIPICRIANPDSRFFALLKWCVNDRDVYLNARI